MIASLLKFFFIYRFLLTQIICGDISKDLASMAHEIKKRLGLPFNCRCCIPKAEQHNNNAAIEQRNQPNVNKNSYYFGSKIEQVGRIGISYLGIL